MPANPIMPVFISIIGEEGVKPARWYQTSAYNIFINDNSSTSREFKYCKLSNNTSSDTNDNDSDVKESEKEKEEIVFTIAKFDHNSGLNGLYPSFCTLLNDKGETHVLSNDKEALSNFHGYRTRLTM